MSMKNPLTRAWIEPATFRFVAQHLNHCGHAVPCLKDIDSKSRHEISIMMDIKSVLETRIIFLPCTQVCVVCRRVVANVAYGKVKLTRQKCCVCGHPRICLLTRPVTSRHV